MKQRPITTSYRLLIPDTKQQPRKKYDAAWWDDLEYLTDKRLRVAMLAAGVLLFSLLGMGMVGYGYIFHSWALGLFTVLFGLCTTLSFVSLGLFGWLAMTMVASWPSVDDVMEEA